MNPAFFDFKKHGRVHRIRCDIVNGRHAIGFLQLRQNKTNRHQGQHRRHDQRAFIERLFSDQARNHQANNGE